MSVHGVQKLEQEVTRPYRDTVERLATALDLDAPSKLAFAEAGRRRPPQQPAGQQALNAESHLPVPPTSFVGRRAELAHIGELLVQPLCRLVTLVGPGGVGKTRLAIEAARAQIGAFSNGVHFVPLAPVESPRLLAAAIGEALGISLAGPEAASEQIARSLLDKDVLLVLDNFEHLIASVDVLVDLLRESGVKLVVTSRERLNLQGEFVFEVGGLNFPVSSPSDDPRQYSAVELFTERARQVQPTFSLLENIQAVVAICKQLEGLPLGLELAATWLRVMPCHDVAQQIERSLDFLVTPMRDVPERHRSLRAVLDHSWRLLSDPERRVLARLSVFRGGFALDSAQDVGDATLPLLASLVDRSLVRVTRSGRYELQEPMRQYLTEQLLQYGETATVADRHLRFFLGLAQTAEEHLHGPDQQTWFDRLEVEHDNLAAALAWSVGAPRNELGLRLCNALGFFWELRSHWYEADDWFTQLVQERVDGPLLLRANALRNAAVFAEYMGDSRRGRAYCEDSTALARQIGDRWSIGWGLATMGMYVEGRTDLGKAGALLEEALAIFREIGDGWGTSHALRRLGINLLLRGQSARARPILEEALAEARAVGDENALAWSLYLLGNATWVDLSASDKTIELLEEALSLSPRIRDAGNEMWVLFTLGAAARANGRLNQSESYYARVLEHVLERQVVAALNWPELISGALAGLAGVAFEQGDPTHAARLLGAASHSPDPQPAIFFRLDRQSDTVAARGQLGEAKFDTAFADGARMPIEEALVFALQRVSVSTGV